MNQWSPKISIPECDKIITAPGQPLEVENAIINGIVLRVYKNLPIVSLTIKFFFFKIAIPYWPTIN